MKVFLSWSGEQSGHIAQALRRWLPEVIQAIEPWLSNEDIGAGARWNSEVSKALEDSVYGILVVTSDNVEKPWLNFEAGALAKSMNEGRVCPYVHGMEPTDIPPGPLTQFQAKRANRSDTLKLILDLNDVLPEKKLDKAILAKTFDRSWDDLAAQIADAPVATSVAARRTTDQILDELLTISRRLDGAMIDTADAVKQIRADVEPPGRDGRPVGGVQLTKTKVIRELRSHVDQLAESAGVVLPPLTDADGQMTNGDSVRRGGRGHGGF